TLAASDPDTVDTITFSLDNDAGGRFAIAPDSGVIRVAEGALLDREQASAYTIVARATSSDGSYSTRTFSISLLDSNEFQTSAIRNIAPVTSQNKALLASASSGTPVGIQAFAEDADATDNRVTYRLTDDAGGVFAIDANTGTITVADAARLATTNRAALDIVVAATSEDGSSQTRAFNIQISLPQAPNNNSGQVVIIDNGSNNARGGENNSASGSTSNTTSSTSSSNTSDNNSATGSSSGTSGSGGNSSNAVTPAKPSSATPSTKVDSPVVQPGQANNPIVPEHAVVNNNSLAVFEPPPAIPVQNVAQAIVGPTMKPVGSQDYKLFSVELNRFAINDVVVHLVSQSTFSKSAVKTQDSTQTDLSYVAQRSATQETLVSTVQVNSTKMVGVSLSVGVAWWALRAGGLLASLAASLPTWRGIDTLMILRDREEGDDWGQDREEQKRRREKMLPDEPSPDKKAA
ncbi:MAG TPA: cadherin repeat domain-containing protein, partial [Accumulibacter sp.]|nr:cadherin repeat domain-containing protein [Accumulibacter sp.]